GAAASAVPTASAWTAGSPDGPAVGVVVASAAAAAPSDGASAGAGRAAGAGRSATAVAVARPAGVGAAWVDGGEPVGVHRTAAACRVRVAGRVPGGAGRGFSSRP